MDSEGARLIVRDILLNNDLKFDVYIVIADGDAKITSSIETLKTKILKNHVLTKQYPHLNNCTSKVLRDFCTSHITKHILEKLQQLIKDWKKKYNNNKKMPKHSSVTDIIKYTSVALTDILDKYTGPQDRCDMVLQLFDHLAINSKHNSTLCKDRGCDKNHDMHIKLPISLAKYLTKHLSTYINSSVLKKVVLMTTTNQVETINKSITRLLPKNIFHRNTNVIDCLTCVVMLQSNHGQIINKNILIKLGFTDTDIPQRLIDEWMRLDRKKQQKRIDCHDPTKQQRAKGYKKARKQDNTEKTQKYKATRKKKGEIIMYDLH